MRVNARKGLLRLWIVGSLVWVLVALIWLRPDVTIAHLVAGPSIEELAFHGTDCSLVTGCPAVPPSLFLPQGMNGLEREQDFIETEKAQPSYQAHDRAAIRGEDFWRLTEDVGIVFGPSVAVLLLGAALSWAMRGFRA
jgi:hypothetical protein